MRVNAYSVVATLALVAMNASAPSAAAETQSRCAVSTGADLDCGTASLSIRIDYARCELGPEANPGIWHDFCPIVFTLHVTASGWANPGSWSANWPGWCGPASRSWGPALGNYPTQDDATVTCQTWPDLPAWCPSVGTYTRTESVTVQFHGVASPAGGDLPGTSPGSLTVHASAPGPRPPSSLC